jgi:hypothetical protein
MTQRDYGGWMVRPGCPSPRRVRPCETPSTPRSKISPFPRHRLPPQPHGFEGLCAVDEDSDAPDLAIDEVEDGAGGLIGGEPACSSRGGDLRIGEHAIIANRLQALDGDVEVGSRVLDVGPVAPDAGGALKYPLQRGKRRLQLDVRRAAGEVAVDIPLVERLDRPLDDFEVLPRIAYSRRPTASRASALVSKNSARTILEFRRVTAP